MVLSAAMMLRIGLKEKEAAEKLKFVSKKKFDLIDDPKKMK